VKFAPIPLSGAWLIHLDPHADGRGSFARAFCAEEFAQHRLETSFIQANLSTNRRAGTVRGMHFQRAPDAEVKLVRCTNGSLYDVIVDIREDSPTRLRWFGAVLSEENGAAMYVPKGFAHGYQALTDEAAAFYMVSSAYAPASESGLRFDDPRLAIEWPLAVSEVSEKDRRWPLLDG
jgi:dTDP-4-dehydrorhamnose 3,5-epimerase